jgi:hypothetical protein
MYLTHVKPYLFKFKYVIFIAFAFSLFWVQSVFAKTVTFEREYEYQASEADSKLTCRAIALEQVQHPFRSFSDLRLIGCMLKTGGSPKVSAGSGNTGKKWFDYFDFLGAGAPRNSPSVLKSSSMSGQ